MFNVKLHTKNVKMICGVANNQRWLTILVANETQAYKLGGKCEVKVINEVFSLNSVNVADDDTWEKRREIHENSFEMSGLFFSFLCFYIYIQKIAASTGYIIIIKTHELLWKVLRKWIVSLVNFIFKNLYTIVLYMCV